MTETKNKFKSIWRSEIRGDETSTTAFEILEPITVKEMCEYILTTDEWGYIGIKQGNWFPFGNPQIEYTDHHYKTEMNWSDKILNAQIKKMQWSGGWSRGDWLFEI